jgi:hypothetical protein
MHLLRFAFTILFQAFSQVLGTADTGPHIDPWGGVTSDTGPKIDPLG